MSAIEFIERPFIQSGMSLTQIMMVFLDHLRDNRMVETVSFKQHDQQIICQFGLCPFKNSCSTAHDKQLACQQICVLAQEILSQGGYQVQTETTLPTENTAQIAFHIQLKS